MYVQVDATDALVHDADDTGRLHVESALTGADLDAALRATGAGHAGDDAAWLAVDFLRTWADPSDRVHWEPRFEAMLDFARAHGWTSADGEHVRAHVVTSEGGPR